MAFVDQTTQPSKMRDASDLPQDPMTIRFFFNMGVEAFNTAIQQNFIFNDNNNNNNNEEGKARFFPPGVQIMYPTSNYVPLPICGYGALPQPLDSFHGGVPVVYAQSESPIEHNGTVYFRHLNV